MSLSFFNQAGLDLFLEPLGITLDVDSGGMMKQAIKDGCSNNLVTKDFILLGESSVRSEDHGSFLVAAGDKLEEKMRPVTVNRDVADLINDQEFRLTVERKAFFNAVLSVSSGKVSDKG